MAELILINAVWRNRGFTSRNDFIVTAAVNEARQQGEAKE
jgi:uncharacterized protein (DUF1778 family)